jgi:hypothetical protein
MQTFDLTPDPKVLLALTHTPMQPLDALCELIDNAIDSFQAATLQGRPIKHPLVIVDLPRLSDLLAGTGVIRVRDNGTGLDPTQAENALRAGFSGNNPYDSLGLFGMGFNISTGKLGRKTRFITIRKEDTQAIEVTVDLEQVRLARTFQVPVNLIPRPTDFVSGTLVEVGMWWSDGNPNSGFVRKLIQYGMPKVREEIGRRYATILRDKNIQIVINGEACQPFEHCIWSDHRSVERKGQGKIPAVLRFDESFSSPKRCTVCTTYVEGDSSTCQACGSSSLRTVTERVSGWIGIQRFDDPTEFGIDLIRNGRAIRIAEKTAFFEFTDEFKRTIKDYPIDGSFGRIVGEVHLNHVPVDFLKQDFQRTSPEWLKAMSFLRGESSLQPTQPGADTNKSPVYRLYQGFRRVRNFGRGDMYMGVWDASTDGPRRISRDIESTYRTNFRNKLPGFYDDAEWWKHVEQADTRPLEELVECNLCSAQNLKGHDTCISCSNVLIGKCCVKTECAKLIAQSATSCPFCGVSQVPEIVRPWSCLVCGVVNKADLSDCSACTSARGTLNSLSRERILSHSSKDDELSIAACTIPLADGVNSSPIDVDVYLTTEPIVPNPQGKSIPLYALKSPERVEVFLDMMHPLFKAYNVRPEQLIAAEVALVLYDAHRRLSGSQHQGLHTLSTLTWQILQARWQSRLEDSANRVRVDIEGFFSSIRENLPLILNGLVEDIYDDLEESKQRHMVANMVGRGADIRKLAEMRSSGEYLNFVDETTVVELFRQHTAAFLDGKFWVAPWSTIGQLPDGILEGLRADTKSLYVNCLDDLVGYLRYREPDTIVVLRARASLMLLQQKLV